MTEQEKKDLITNICVLPNDKQVEIGYIVAQYVDGYNRGKKETK